MADRSSAAGRPAGAATASPRCAVCGTESRQPVFRPVQPEQPPDLDFRPGEPLRSTMARWLQQCPDCGYAAPDLAQAPPGAAAAVRAAPFLALRGEGGHPQLARRFLARAHVLEETGDLAGAADATLHAAWVADDLGQKDLARRWRRDAVALWRGGPPPDAEGLVRVIDALRRCKDWAGAQEAADALSARSPAGHLDRVLDLERRLVAARDPRRHTVGSALPPPARRPHVTHQAVGRGRTAAAAPPGGEAPGGGLRGALRRLFGRG